MSQGAWRADLQRYPRRPWLKEQSIYAIAVYRFGRWIGPAPTGWQARVMLPVYWLAFRLVETATGISLPRTAVIGPGLRIWHFGNIFIHPAAVLGTNCTLRQGVTIGNRRDDGPVPVLGNDVELGAYAQLLGGITIGHRARIGAMAVVLEDVPDGGVAVGNPARILLPDRGGSRDSRNSII